MNNANSSASVPRGDRSGWNPCGPQSICATKVHRRAIGQLESLLVRSAQNRLARVHTSPSIVVAVPVCNEADRILRCLEALSAQRSLSGHLLPAGLTRVVLLTNNCTDRSYELVQHHMDELEVAISLFDVVMPKSKRNAGKARRLVNHAAIELLVSEQGLLFMTDADSAVPPHWIASYRRLLRNGYEAVAGSVALHPTDCDQLDAALRARGQLEATYTELLDQLDTLIDPIPHDPWPRHYNASGANIAVRLDALAEIPDFPDVACGEDRLFIRSLEAHGRRVRHDCDTRVLTSGRLIGRAKGGMADTLQRRITVPDSPCDLRLEPADRAYFRATLRAHWRKRWPALPHDAAAMQSLRGVLAVDTASFTVARQVPTFEAAWQRLETMSAVLERHCLTPADLPGEILRARTLLESFARRGLVQEAVA